MSQPSFRDLNSLMLCFKGLDDSIDQAQTYRTVLAKSAHFPLLVVQLARYFSISDLSLSMSIPARLSLPSLFVQGKPFRLIELGCANAANGRQTCRRQGLDPRRRFSSPFNLRGEAKNGRGFLYEIQ
jgi:hypothetical protein